MGEGLRKAIQDSGLAAQVQRIGAMFCLYFTAETVLNYETAKQADTAQFAQYFWSMLKRGIYLPPSQFEACFLSLALDEAMIEETIEHAREVFCEVRIK